MQFQSLGELHNSLSAASPAGYVVDPGIPLIDMTTNPLPESWARQSSVRKVTSYIARLVCSLDLSLYERVSDNHRQKITWDDSPEGQLAWSLGNPSDAAGQTVYRFWYAVIMDGLIYDRWCVGKYRDEEGRLRLRRIPARRARFIANSLDELDRVEVWMNGERKVLDPEGLIVDFGYAERGCGGSSPLEALRDILRESQEAVAYRRDMWRNGARIPGVLEWDKAFPPDGAMRSRFLNAWAEYREGGSRAGQEPVLEHGMTYRQLSSLTSDDAQDIEGRKFNDVEVASAYHIAPELVGAREGNYSNIIALKESLYRLQLGPYIAEWEQAVNRGLREELQSTGKALYVEADREQALRGSLEDEISAGVKATGRPVMTTNEFRSRLNRPPVEGGDKIITPLNVSVGGQMPTEAGVQNEEAENAL